MRFYDIKLANDENWYLTTEMTLTEVKQYIQSNKWIKLQSCGKKFENGWTVFIPTESDIQTCNIVYINENTRYQKVIDECKQNKIERTKILDKINKYKFNFRFKLWFFRNSLYTINTYLKEANKAEDCVYDLKFLNEILEKCKKFKCRLKE